MTRKHFKAIATAIKNTKSLKGQDKKDLVDEISRTFLDLNPLFDKERFVAACGRLD